MDKHRLRQEFIRSHNDLVDFILDLNEIDFAYCLPKKWSAGQHLKHILLSIQATDFVLTGNKYLEPTNPDQKTFTYQELKINYLIELKRGLKAPPRFIPDGVLIQTRKSISNDVNKTTEQICLKIDNLSESQLDLLSVPHPVFKKLTIRELIYFSIYHSIHHLNLIKLMFHDEK